MYASHLQFDSISNGHWRKNFASWQKEVPFWAYVLSGIEEELPVIPNDLWNLDGSPQTFEILTTDGNTVERLRVIRLTGFPWDPVWHVEFLDTFIDNAIEYEFSDPEYTGPSPYTGFVVSAPDSAGMFESISIADVNNRGIQARFTAGPISYETEIAPVGVPQTRISYHALGNIYDVRYNPDIHAIYINNPGYNAFLYKRWTATFLPLTFTYDYYTQVSYVNTSIIPSIILFFSGALMLGTTSQKPKI